MFSYCLIGSYPVGWSFVLVNRSDEISERKFAGFGASRNDGVQPSRQILCAQRIALRAVVRIRAANSPPPIGWSFVLVKRSDEATALSASR